MVVTDHTKQKTPKFEKDPPWLRDLSDADKAVHAAKLREYREVIIDLKRLRRTRWEADQAIADATARRQKILAELSGQMGLELT